EGPQGVARRGPPPPDAVTAVALPDSGAARMSLEGGLPARPPGRRGAERVQAWAYRGSVAPGSSSRALRRSRPLPAGPFRPLRASRGGVRLGPRRPGETGAGGPAGQVRGDGGGRGRATGG